MIGKDPFTIRHIRTSDGHFLMSPKNDFAFKRLFGDENNKDLLISFLSAVLKINIDQFSELQLINTELTAEFLEDRKGILDVRAKLNNGTMIDIEIQLSYTKYMAERALYYWSRMYSGNIAKGDNYSKLKKCITINILDFIGTPLDKAYSKYSIKEDETGYRLTDVLEIYYLELPKLDVQEQLSKLDEDDPTLRWMLFLEADNKEAIDMLGKKYTEIKKAVDILEVMSQSEKDRMNYEAREAQLRDISTGLEEAEERGMEKGMEKGLEKGILIVAQNLVKSGLPIDTIIETTGLTREAIEEIQQQLTH